MAPAVQDEASRDTLDVRSLWFTVRRRLGVILTIFISCTLLAAIITSQTKDTYQASTRVVIDPRDRQIIDASVVSDLRPDSTIMDTEVQLILSRDMMNKVVDELNLKADPEFNPLLRKTNGAPLNPAEPVATAGVSATSEATNNGLVKGIEDGSIQAPEASELLDVGRMLAADSLQEAVRARREGLTYVISITAKSESPEKAALIANTLTSIYISGQLTTKIDETVRAGDWLQDRLAILREEVRITESAVQEFRTSQGLVETGGISTIEAKIASLTSQLLVLQADLVEKQSRYEEAMRYSEADAISAQHSDVIESSLLTTLRSQRADMARVFADVATQYSDLHPEYIRARNQLEELDGSIAAERRRVLSSLSSNVQVARSRVSAVENELSRLNAQLNRNNVDMIRQRELEREARASREIYEGLLNRAEQVTQAAQLQRSDAHLVSAAEPPTRPSAPNHKINLLLGALVGVALAGFAALMLEMFEKGLSSTDDVEKYIGLPLITTVPAAPVKRWGKTTTVNELSQYMLKRPRSAFTEGIRALYNTLYRAGRRDSCMTVAFTSALPGEGKTTLSYCVAIMAAAHRQRVLIIDGDLYRRSLSATIAPDAENGLLEVIQGKIPAEEAIRMLDGDHFSVLPVAETAETENFVLTHEDCERVFAALRPHYDIIIIDCPPALPVLEARVIGSAADNLVFAARWRKTHRKAIAKVVQMLTNEGARIVGLAITRADLRTQALYEDFGASHYKLYAAYYRN